MPGFLHSTNVSVINCSHGGMAIPIPTQNRVLLGYQPVITSKDSLTITGCSFAPGGKFQPCVTLKWLNPSKRVFINGTPVLLSDSFALCQSAEQIFQGISINVQNQKRVQGI